MYIHIQGHLSIYFEGCLFYYPKGIIYMKCGEGEGEYGGKKSINKRPSN